MSDDGVLMPNVRRLVQTSDGPVLFAFRGYTLPSAGSGVRQVIASMVFRTDVERHRWLNHAVGVPEGGIDFTDMTTTFPAYVCIAT